MDIVARACTTILKHWRPLLWNDTRGNEVQEYWLVNGMGHGWSGGSSSGTFTDPQGPGATQAVYNFFINSSVKPQPSGTGIEASPFFGRIGLDTHILSTHTMAIQ